jgi:MSHA biogenesis protein MshP
MNARTRRFQRGVSLLTALFLIVTIASLGAVAVQIGTTQRQTSNFATLGGRAYAAAQAGIEWGAYQALTANACGAAGINATLALAEDALNGFTVQVRCAPPQAQNDCATPYNVYDITAFAQRGVFGTQEYVSRRIDKRFAVPTC